VPSLWTFKEGANAVGLLDSNALWNLPQLQSIILKNRIDSRPHLARVEEKLPG
jgi:hypothetical protein